MHLVIESVVTLVQLPLFEEKREVAPTHVLYYTHMYLQSGSTFWDNIFLAPYF